MSDDEPRAALQRNVQRLLGRCLLRIQQYERLMKAMLAGHELAGPVEALAARRQARIDRFSGKSLGLLAESLFETAVVPEGFKRELLTDKDADDGISMALGVRLSLEPESWARAKAAIEELVALRNGMVHHLIEQFDLWTDEGCVAATTHLENAYDRIDRHYVELEAWAKGMADAQEAAAALSQSDDFFDLVIKGTGPQTRQ
jgi:hypothetical protein